MDGVVWSGVGYLRARVERMLTLFNILQTFDITSLNTYDSIIVSTFETLPFKFSVSNRTPEKN